MFKMKLMVNFCMNTYKCAKFQHDYTHDIMHTIEFFPDNNIFLEITSIRGEWILTIAKR